MPAVFFERVLYRPQKAFRAKFSPLDKICSIPVNISDMTTVTFDEAWVQRRHEQWQIWESMPMPMPMFFGGTIFNANVNANISLGRLFNGNANVNSFSSALSMLMSMAMSDQCQ